MPHVNPNDYIITRKRKKYRFALFANSPLCFEYEQWTNIPAATCMELGAGSGLFSVALATNNPDQQVVAVDVKADRLQTGAQIAHDSKLANIRFLRARVGQLPDIITPGSLASVWMTFPDPYPKARSAKHRLTHPSFLSLYQRFLAPGGALYFKTDAHDLFTWSLEQLVQQGWTLHELSFDLHESQLPDWYKVKTTYETRFTERGLPIYFVHATPPGL